MIDAGAFLTTTVGSGSGTSMPVADVKYFYDGHGIDGEAGDMIRLAGDTRRAQVIGIDYTRNLLMLAQPLTWNDGQRVALAYDGDAPDLGAYEYGDAPAPPPEK
jgi:hypothetical protein